MKREIEFRAKRLSDGKWLYGDLIRYGGTQILHTDGEYSSVLKTDKVDENTIGQYTGLKDRNGKKIYEGDILSYTVFDYNDNDTQYKGVIRFDDEAATYYLFSSYNEDIDYEAFELGWVVSQDCDCEVIGNIYDNKELLEENK